MKTLNKSTIITVLGAIVFGFGLGWLFFGGSGSPDAHDHAHVTENKNETWTCSMHPQIRQPEFGKCPICGMDLITVNADSDAENDIQIKMSPTAMQLANVRTSVIRKQKPVKELRLNGKVQADERHIFSQTSHISGRIEKLMVGYTGEYIRKGQVIAFVYSPELVTAQEELFEAYKIRESQPVLFKAAKEKLKNWKLTESQIEGILKSGVPAENFPILSDLTGIVIAKKVNLGDHIMRGAPIFEVANLSQIWVLFDVYESDIPWVKKNDEVTFTVQSLPGEEFHGKISFIDPVINPKTRVAKARVALSNPNQRLKPEMFAVGQLKSPLKNSKPAIIVPKSSIMWTGERSVVYVKTSTDSGISFSMREVVLGPALGDSYIVVEGLKEGEELATHGTFSIDAAAQLAGKPSMMNPGKKTSETNTDTTEDDATISINKKAKEALNLLINKYGMLKDALVKDNFEEGQKAAVSFQNQLKKIKMNLFKGESHKFWMEYQSETQKAIDMILKAKDISNARNEFIQLSNQMISLGKTFKPTQKVMYVQFCPMADNNKGAYWLSFDKEVLNPYFGASMLRCGEVKQEIRN